MRPAPRLRLVLPALLVALLLAFAATGALADGGKGKGNGKGDKDRGDAGEDGRRGDDHADEDDPEDEARDGRENDRDEKDGRDDDREDDERGGKGGKGKGQPDRERTRPARQAPHPQPQPQQPVVDVALAGDAAVRQSVHLEPGRFAVLLVVGGVGLGTATDVRLGADLPDFGSAWALSGAGSAQCTLSGSRLDCAFGDLAPGELRLLQVAADVAVMPAWQVEARSTVASANDAHAGNDVARSSVGILLT